MNKILVFFSALLICIVSGCAQNKKTDYVVTIKTKYGDMTAILYDETPKHKENFIKLAKDKFYDSLLFHRVIYAFMIQGGDPNSKNATPDQSLGMGGPGYEIDAEFNSKFIHEKGALSAARRGGGNPDKKSSGSQFYIVHGKKMSEEELKQLEESIRYQRKSAALGECLTMPQCADIRQTVIDMQRSNNVEWLQSFFEKSDTLIQKHKPDYKTFAFTDKQKETYMQVGGAPHLDGDYTVFGKVIKGLEVIDKIAEQPKNPGDRPIEDIRMTVTVEEMSRKKIEKEYGYKFPE